MPLNANEETADWKSDSSFDVDDKHHKRVLFHEPISILDPILSKPENLLLNAHKHKQFLGDNPSEIHAIQGETEAWSAEWMDQLFSVDFGSKEAKGEAMAKECVLCNQESEVKRILAHCAIAHTEVQAPPENDLKSCLKPKIEMKRP